MKKRILLYGLALSTCFLMPSLGNAQSFSESFNDISTLAGSGWVIQNNSSPIGSLSWFQGTATTATPTPGPFDAYNGAANAYIAANFNSTGSTGTISNWLITPNRTIRNGDVFTFYTRKPTIGGGQTDYPDRLEVRLSTNGASTNVGTGATAVGDFTTLLLSINPTLTTGVYPQVWTQYTITISGLPAPTSGRIAFRYFVTGAGSLGSASDYIGIDQVDYTPYVCPAFTMTTGGALAGGAAGSAYSTSLTQTGALGAPNYAITSGALPPGVTLSASGTISGTPTATGTFNFTVTVSDASGCSGAQAYSITVVCPSNPITIANAPTLCTNDGAYTLVEGSPAGGTYSGTGVSAGQFDPSIGTQIITYDYTDPYGCPFSSTYTITVNSAPVVTQSAINPVCENEGIIALSGGSPAGGAYAGTGVTGSDFDPTVGTQTIEYIYTDANNCSDNVFTTITVNSAPVVTQSAINAVCENEGIITLSGGSPAGGFYAGTGVNGGDFDPTVGTETIEYIYTDANNCSDTAFTTITVNLAPVASHSTINAVCVDGGVVTLTGGSPAGGVYAGTGVNGTDFNPATAGVGTQVISYIVVENGCSDTTLVSITVNACIGVAEDMINVLKIFPNPTSSYFNIETLQSDWKIEQVSLLDVNGRMVRKYTQTQGSFDLSGVTAGVYFVQFLVNGTSVQSKLIIQ